MPACTLFSSDMFIRTFILSMLGSWGVRWRAPATVGIAIACLSVVVVWTLAPWLIASAWGVGWMSLWLAPTTIGIVLLIVFRHASESFG